MATRKKFPESEIDDTKGETVVQHNATVCPNCGHCPTCGRSNHAPVYPYPYTWPYRPWWGTFSVTTTTPNITYA